MYYEKTGDPPYGIYTLHVTGPGTGSNGLLYIMQNCSHKTRTGNGAGHHLASYNYFCSRSRFRAMWLSHNKDNRFIRRHQPTERNSVTFVFLPSRKPVNTDKGRMFPQAMNVRDLGKGGNEYFINGCGVSGFTCEVIIILTRLEGEVQETWYINRGRGRNWRDKSFN